MAVLQPSEYTAEYFEGASQTYTHNAGYSDYHRVNYNTRGNFVPIEDSTGTMFGDLFKYMNIQLNSRFVGKSVLVIGCAYGFEVQALRDLGIDAWGVDVSQFAIDQADSSVAPYLEVADIRTKILTYNRNYWDYIISMNFLSCMSDDDLTVGTFAGEPLIAEMNRVCKSDQVHIVRPANNPTFYNAKPIATWATLPFEVGTILIENWDVDNYVTVINQ